MEEKTWNMESEIRLKINELEVEHKYWKDISNTYAETYINSNYTNSETGMLFKIAQNLSDLAYLKIEMLKKMI